MKKLIWIIIILVVVWGIWFRGEKPAPVGSGEVVKIGGLFGQTGYASFAGESSRDGFLMAIEDSGSDVDYVIEDFKSNLTDVVTSASKLIDVNKVSVIIGPEWNEFSEIVVPIAQTKRVVFISPWMTSEDDWSKDGHYFFSATPSERDQIKSLLGYMVRHGHEKIFLIYSNNSWSFGNVEMLKDELKTNTRVKLVGEFKANQDATDYRTEITKIRSLQPDAVYSFIATDDSQGIFTKQLRESGSQLQIYTTSSHAENPVFIKNFSSYVVGTIYPRAKEYKNIQSFNEKFEKRFGHKPAAISAATTYDMTTLVLKAINSGAKTADEVRDYLLATKDYEGYSNLINFNERGQVATEAVVIKQITPDGFKILEE